jgi:undecaprenyl-phosphate galactose phosphotransferase
MYALWGKAWLDRGVAALALVFAAPVFALLALAVLLALGRPILFRQRRAGLHGAPFTLLKFRSMRAGEAPDAARLSRFGRWLRASGIDELPQMINVLRGEMSLVGPRPIVSEELEKYGLEKSYYLMVRPGMTGLWQVSGRNNVDYDARVYLDAWYVKNWSLWYDLAILFKTFKVVLAQRGAY